MENTNYGKWFDDVNMKTGSADATRQLFRCLSVPEDGSGLLLILAFAVQAIEQSVGKDSTYQAWVSHIRLVYTATANLVARYPTLSKPTSRENKRDTYGPICLIAAISHSKLHQTVLESMGWILVDALRSNVQISVKTAQQLLTLQRAGDRTSHDGEWDALRACLPLSKATIQSIITKDGNGEAKSLAKKLYQAAFVSLNAPAFGNAQTTAANETGTNGELEPQSKPEKTEKRSSNKRKQKTKKEIAPPSVKTLMARASYMPALSVFGLADVVDRLPPPLLKQTVAAMAADLSLMGNTDRPAMAAVAILSLYINHTPASTFKLSLEKNNDIWLEKDAHLYFNRKAYLGLKGETTTQDIIRIALPRKIRSYLQERLKRTPTAATLAELLEIGDPSAWLSKIEYYLTSLGDSAHKSRPGRVVHSLALVYLHLGASLELAALDTLSPELVGDSTLNYIRFQYSEVKSMRSKAADYLDLGEIDEEESTPEWIGSHKCPSDQEFQDDWKLQSDNSAAAIESVKSANTVEEVILSFNKGSSANTRAHRATTGGRMQLTAHPTQRDLLTNESYIFTYDKKTKPSSARLTPRTDELNGVIRAQQLLVIAAKKRLLKLGIEEKELPPLLVNPSYYSAFFIELKTLPPKQEGSSIRVKAQAITPKTVSTLVKNDSNLASNSSRHFWGSKCAKPGNPLWLERALLGHGRKLAHVGSWCTSTPPSILLSETSTFMKSTLDELKLETYAEIVEPKVKLLPITMNLKAMDKTKKNSNGFNRDMPINYCDATTAPAITVVDSLRNSLTGAIDSKAACQVLISIVMGDGISSVQDLKSTWKALEEPDALKNSRHHKWTRYSGQEIELPMQPSTRVHLERLEKLPGLEETTLELKKQLQIGFPDVTWPDTAVGIQTALCWLMCRWLRVHMSPLLLFCYDASTAAATYSKASIARLLNTARECTSPLGSLETIAARKSHAFGIDNALSQLSPTVWKIANGDKKLGGDLRRSQLLKAELLEKFEQYECEPSVELFVAWLHIETSAWINKEPDLIEVAVMYEYMTRVLHRVKSYPYFSTSIVHLTKAQWKALVGWILNVDDCAKEKQANTLLNRVIALRRIFGSLINSGQYKIPTDLIPDIKINQNRTWCESASRVYVSQTSIAEVKACIDHIYKEWEIQRCQIHFLHDLAIKACARSDEMNALMVSHCGKGVAVLTECGFSHIKTDGSHRPAHLDANLSDQIDHLLKLLSQLPEQPRMLFSEDYTKINLQIGRAKQSVLVDLYRQVLNDQDFIFHSLRVMSVEV